MDCGRLVVLTPEQLEEVVRGAVEDAVGPLREELRRLAEECRTERPQAEDPDRILYGQDAIAAWMGISKRTLYEMIARGETAGTVCCVVGKYRAKAADVDRFCQTMKRRNKTTMENN